MNILTKLLARCKMDVRSGESRASEESEMSQGGHERGVKIEFERPPVYVNNRGVLYINPGDILRSRVGREAIEKAAAFAREQRSTHKAVGK